VGSADAPSIRSRADAFATNAINMKLLFAALACATLACSTSSSVPSAPDASVQTPAFIASKRIEFPAHHKHPPVKTDAKKKPLKAPFNPNTPPSWLVTQWYVDPANATSCASDNNSCTSASCAAGGVGPCLTWSQLTKRFGTTSPIFGQDVTITFLSSQAANDTDPIIFHPVLANGSSAFVTGALTATSSGTFTGVTAKNRSTDQLWIVTTSGPTPAQFTFMQDTARSSFFWYVGNTPVAYGPAGSITQPLAATSVAGYTYLNPELDTIVLHDAYTTYSMFGINLVDVSATLQSFNNDTENNGLIFEHLNIIDTDVTMTGETPAAGVGQYVGFIECGINKKISGNGAPYDSISILPAFHNCAPTGGFPPFGTSFFGGLMFPGSIGYVASDYCFLDDDVWNAGVVRITTSIPLSMGYVYDHGAFQINGVTLVQGFNPFGAGTDAGTIWGPGSVDVSYNGRLGNLTGSPFAATFLFTGGLTMDGSGSAYAITDAGVWSSKAIGVTNLDQPISDGGFGGSAIYPQIGASITNDPL
jgi:hypothetical protein